MEILSISIDKAALRRLEGMQKRMKYKSRSKMLRNALLAMLEEYERVESLSGKIESVFVLTYRYADKNRVSDLLHEFEGDVETEVHHHHSGTCIDVLNINTDSAKTIDIYNTLKSNGHIYSVTYSIVSRKL